MGSPSTDQAAELAYVDIKPVLARLGELATTQLVLVGGQAINFWVDYYQRQGRVLDLEGGVPLTSKDIDFCGDRDAVRLCALRLNGAYLLPGLDDNTPNTGLVTFVDDQGVKRVIDFIAQPHGLNAKDVHRTALHVDLLDAQGQPSGLSFAVMHPVWCMMSRVHNTMGLPGYASPHALRQLRASVHCAREFLIDLLNVGELRAVLKLNERIFSFCHWKHAGLRVQPAYGIDPFDAVIVDEQLSAKFCNTRYPQMVEWLTARRKRLPKPQR